MEYRNYDVKKGKLKQQGPDGDIINLILGSSGGDYAYLTELHYLSVIEKLSQKGTLRI